MKLKHMIMPKKTKAELKADSDSMPSPSEDRYPWGLRLNMGPEALDTLGLQVDKMKVGETITLQAKAEVVELSKRQSTGQEMRQHLALQITHLGLESSSSFEGGFKGDEKGEK